MLKSWLPKDRILKRAVYALLAFFLFAVLAGGLRRWDERRHGGSEEGSAAVAEAVLQFGPTSTEAANAIKQMGAAANPQEIVALLDPTTGKAIAAWPTEMAGKLPEEMTLANGSKVPALAKQRARDQFEGESEDRSAVSVRLTPIYPWSGEKGRPEGRSEGRQDQGGFRSHEGRGDRGGFEGKGFNKPLAVDPPKAILLVAAPHVGVTPLRVVTGVAGALAAVFFVLYWLSVAWWVFTDARRHGGKAFAWGALTLLTNLVGAAVYLVARREQKVCAGCGTGVERSFNHCPHCGRTLKRVCAHCGHDLREGWTHCASCGVPYTTEPPKSEE